MSMPFFEKPGGIPLGLDTQKVCCECPRIAAYRCPDGEWRCRGHARKLAQSIAKQAKALRYCSTPQQRKARSKRRAKNKVAKLARKANR